MITLNLLLCLPAFAPAQTLACSDVYPRVLEGQPGPEGGQLAAPTPPYGATLAGGGRVAFVSSILGATRNQAVMISDGTRVRAIAVGCGGAGGSGAPGACGDPTPIGGTFAGFFADPFFAPATNAAGDVLFLADLFGAAAPRGLFLYRSATAAIEIVAAVGAVSPSGVTITSLGLGSLDVNGNAVFLARTGPGQGQANEILAYDAGVLSVVAREGGVGPGGMYAGVANGLVIMPDNTYISVGGVPTRDVHGRVAHFGTVLPTQNTGLALHTPGQAPVWIAIFHQNAPSGGWFNTFGAPQFAPNGEVVFSAQCMIGTNLATSIFAGVPGALRTVLAFQAPIGAATCIGFERTANPFSFIGRGGDVVLWVRIQRPDLSLGEAHVVVRAAGGLEILAETGQPSPIGGTIAELGRWPSIDLEGRVLESARLLGGPNASWLRVPCGTPVWVCDGKPSSLGCTPRIGSIGRASVTSGGPCFVTAHSLPSQSLAILFYGSGVTALPFQGGTLCVAPPLKRFTQTISSGTLPSHCGGTLASDFGALIASGIDPALAAGSSVGAQWFVRDPLDPQGFGSTMSDAVAFTIGP